MANKYIEPPEIDDEELYKVASFGCTYEEIASLYKTTPTWLINNKKDIIDRGKNDMKHKLRRAQLKIAMDENHKNQCTMLIFLGKAILGQREVTEVVQRNDKPSASDFEINQIKPTSNAD